MNRPPRGQVYGEVPLHNSSAAPGQAAFPSPQRTELLALRAILANGGTLVLLDAETSYWSPRPGHVSGSAVLLGNGGGVFDVTKGGVEPREQPAPRVAGARIQNAALDAVGGTAPVGQVANPAIPGAPKGQWTAQTNPDADVEWTYGGAVLRVGEAGRMRTMNAFVFGLRLTPVATLHLMDGVTLRELVDDYVERLRRIVAVATGRPRDLTYLAVELDGEKGWFQVFGSAITQEPCESSLNAVNDASTTVKAQTDELSLLDLIARWCQPDSEYHPLIETYGSMLHAADQHPRSRFPLLILALEGMHGAGTRGQCYRRVAKRTERREAVLAKEKALTDEDLCVEDHRFIKENLQKRPSSGLDGALVSMAKALPINGVDALEQRPRQGPARAGARGVGR